MFADVTTTDVASTGGFWGFAFVSSAWTLKKFDSKAEAYSLCSFTGESGELAV